MKSWEYMTWVVGFAKTDSTVHGGGQVKYRNGTQIQDWKQGKVLVDALNEAGAAGWELVSVSYPVDTHSATHVCSTDPLFIFIRPRSE